jgi:hypothetical protein
MPVQVIAVWEPILWTDRRAPTTMTLSRLADPRVRQFWDEAHTMALRMARDARPPQPVEDCCKRSGFLWDLVAVYPVGARWESQLPPAVVFDGPVFRVTSKIDAALIARPAGRTQLNEEGPRLFVVRRPRYSLLTDSKTMVTN